MKKILLLAFLSLAITACNIDNIAKESKKEIVVNTEIINNETELMQTEILTNGSGTAAKAGDVATVHYTGTLEDGTKFDSSVDRGVPFSFELGAGQVIKGWDQGVAGMLPGEKRKLTIPASLAYGARALPGIPANSTLIFEVELIKAEAAGELQTEILQAGSGTPAKAGDFVKVHYTGTLEDGTKFDSSVDRGTPFQFTLGAGQVIKGWDQGVEGMLPGEKRKLIIPANLAYGAFARPGIPANSTLIFEVEFIESVTPDFLKQ